MHGRDLESVKEEAHNIAQETGANVEAISFDVTDARATQQAVEALIDQFGVPDILVNNAGASTPSAVQ